MTRRGLVLAGVAVDNVNAGPAVVHRIQMPALQCQ